MDGNYIKKYRKERGLTQAQFARELNDALDMKYSAPDISRIENNRYYAPEKVIRYIALKIAEKAFANHSAVLLPKERTTMPSIEISSLISPIFSKDTRKEMTQAEKIIEYMNDFGSITTWEAFTELGITRLASRICDLKKEGYEFDRKTEKALNRYGEGIHYTRYSLRNRDNGTANMD